MILFSSNYNILTLNERFNYSKAVIMLLSLRTSFQKTTIIEINFSVICVYQQL